MGSGAIACKGGSRKNVLPMITNGFRPDLTTHALLSLLLRIRDCVNGWWLSRGRKDG